MNQLINLPGIKGGRVDCQIVTSRAELMRVLKPKLAVTAAGYTGAISVWICDDGYYRSGVNRHGQMINGVNIIGTKAKLREWLNEWWHEIGDQEQIASPR